jgi:hypothetical protein
MMGRMRQYRIYTLADDVQGLRQKYPSQFSSHDCSMLLQGRCARPHEKKTEWAGYTLLRGLYPGISPTEDLSEKAAILAGRADVQSIALSRRKLERLEYFFHPTGEEVFRTVVENAAKLFELIDQHRY